MATTVIAITNQKGGVGKTTTAAALLTGLHRRGAAVLGVDMDPQGSLGFSLGLDIEHCTTCLLYTSALHRSLVQSSAAVMTQSLPGWAGVK